MDEMQRAPRMGMKGGDGRGSWACRRSRAALFLVVGTTALFFAVLGTYDIIGRGGVWTFAEAETPGFVTPELGDEAKLVGRVTSDSAASADAEASGNALDSGRDSAGSVEAEANKKTIVSATSESERMNQGSLFSPADSVLPSLALHLGMSGLGAKRVDAMLKVPPRCTVSHLKPTKGLLVDLDGTIYNGLGLIPSTGSKVKQGEAAREFQLTVTKLKIPVTYISNGFKDKVCTAMKLTQPGYDINRDGGKPMSEEYVETHFWSAARAIALLLEEKFGYKELYAFMLATTSSCGSTVDNCKATILRNVPEEKRRDWHLRMDLDEDEVSVWVMWAARKQTNVAVVLSIETIPRDLVGGRSDLLYKQDQKRNEENFLLVDPVHGHQRSAYKTLTYDVMETAGRLLRNGAVLIAGAPDTLEARPRSDDNPDIDQSVPSIGCLLAYFRTAGELYPGSEKEKMLFRSTGKGGKDGARYMMKQGVELLKRQAASKDIKNGNVVMVGDNILTDIFATVNVGPGEEPYLSVLVRTGAHDPSDCASLGVYPTCWVDDVEELAGLYNEIHVTGLSEWPESMVTA